MKALPFKIPRVSTDAMVIQEDKEKHLYGLLHMHPEIQVTMILNGSGTVYIGEHIGTFNPGDVFVLGSNVPHVFKNDPEYFEDNELYAHAITIFLDPLYLQQTLLRIPESQEIKEFLSKSKKCWKAKQDFDLETSFRELLELKGLDKMLLVLDIIRLIHRSDRYVALMENEDMYEVNETDGRRLKDIIQFTLNHFSESISLEEIANISNMTVPSFCRFFKQRTRRTYVSFLNELRINRACKLLLNKDITILQVSLQTGFNNLSNFNRQFKKIKGVTPSTYKSKHQIN